MTPGAIIGVGILGNLGYDGGQLRWAIDLGIFLGRFRAMANSLPENDESSHDAQNWMIFRMDQISSNQSLGININQLWASNQENSIGFEHRLLENIKFLAGSTACACVIIGRAAFCIGWNKRMTRSSEPSVDPGLWAIEYCCSDLSVASRGLTTIFLRHKARVLDLITIDTLLGKLSEPLRVLIMSPDPHSTNRLRLAEERREIYQAIRRSCFGDAMRLHESPSCRLQDITDALDTYNPNILHFGGHGSPSGLCFENDEGGTAEVNPTAFANLLSTQEELNLVILNTCHSRVHAQIIADAVGYVIGVEGSIPDQDSIIFSREFYRALGYGRLFEDAFERAAAALGLSSTRMVHLFKSSC